MASTLDLHQENIAILKSPQEVDNYHYHYEYYDYWYFYYFYYYFFCVFLWLLSFYSHCCKYFLKPLFRAWISELQCLRVPDFRRPWVQGFSLLVEYSGELKVNLWELFQDSVGIKEPPQQKVRGFLLYCWGRACIKHNVSGKSRGCRSPFQKAAAAANFGDHQSCCNGTGARLLSGYHGCSVPAQGTRYTVRTINCRNCYSLC